MQIANIPIDQIDADSLIRDRSLDDPAALDDLTRSIREIGLRQPVEVFGIETDDNHPRPYGLISGYRRLHACRALGHTDIPALLCNPADLPAAMAAMVAENEVRAQITPWEKGKLIRKLVQEGVFADGEAAIAALHPAASRQHRARIRNAYAVVDAFSHSFTTPERLTTARIDRLAMALRLGGEDVLRLTMRNNHYLGITLEAQWDALRPVLNAMLAEEADTAPHRAPREPRHAMTIRNGKLQMTRELTRTGWIIRFSGEMAKSPGLVDDVFDLVQQWLG
jgi:ParB family transcriptional regulator, chromosome partitioning protein